MNRCIMLLVLCLGAHGYLPAAYNPFVDGAKADVRIKVVDEQGYLKKTLCARLPIDLHPDKWYS